MLLVKLLKSITYHGDFKRADGEIVEGYNLTPAILNAPMVKSLKSKTYSGNFKHRNGEVVEEYNLLQQF